MKCIQRKWYNKMFVPVICMLVVFLCVGCATQTQGEDSEKKIQVAVSIVPEVGFVKAVCGEYVDVVVMIPPGASPENYEPTAKQLEDFYDSEIYFAIGVPAEEASILEHTESMNVVELQKLVAKEYPERTFESGERDPHIWLSPKRVIMMIQLIADKMSEIDPTHQEYYQENADSYIFELTEVDESIQETLSNKKVREFLVYHPAFGYLAEDYDLTMYALEEEGKEATAVHLQEMIDLAKRNEIKVIFYQEEIDGSQATAFAEEIGGQTMQLEPLSQDYLTNMEKMAKLISEVMK